MKPVALFLTLLLLVLTLFSAMAVVWTRHQSRALFVQLTRLQNRRDALGIEYGRLQLEQATWAEPRRIAGEARRRLEMMMPSPRQIRLVFQ